MKKQEVNISDLQKVLTVEANKSLEAIYNALGEVSSYSDIKYKENDNVSIASFKNAKKNIVSFRLNVVSARKEANKPYADISKRLLDFEKDVIKQANDSLTLLETEFKPYLDEEQKKKDELQARIKAKEDALRQELIDKNQSQLLIIERLKEKDRIKTLLEDTDRMVNNAIQTYNKTALIELRDLLEKKSFMFDVSCFDEESIDYLTKLINDNKAALRKNLTNKIESYSTEVKSEEIHVFDTPVYVADTFNQRVARLLEDLIINIRLLPEDKSKEPLINYINKLKLKFI